MKTDLSRFFASLCCAAALAAGSVFCLATAFSVPVESKAVLIACALAAAVFSLVFSLRGPWLRLGAFAAAILACAWFALTGLAALKESCVTVFRLVQLEFINGFPVFSDITQPPLPPGANGTAALMAAGVLLAMVTAWAVCRGARLWLPALCSLPFLVVCLMNIATVPDALPFFVLMGAYALLVVTQAVRRRGDGHHILTLYLAVPTALFVLVLSLLCGPGAAERSEWAERLRQQFKEFSETHALIHRSGDGQIRVVSPLVSQTLGVNVWDSSVSEVDLNEVGPNPRTGARAMEVFASSGGRLYLRGASFARYEGNAWSALSEDDYGDVEIGKDLWLSEGSGTEAVQIKTSRRCAVQYLPYRPEELPEGGAPHFDAYIENSQYAAEYSLLATKLAARSRHVTPEYDDFAAEVYTQVPPETREALAPIVEELMPAGYSISIYGADGEESVSAIAGSGSYLANVLNYVTSAAEYSREAVPVPEGEDFVRWFLEDAETGYCIHYATAAAVLLRCGGVPARLVTGYVADAVAGEWTAVSQDNAHAWVEVFYEGMGWLPYEVTPAALEEMAGSEPEGAGEAGRPSPSPAASPSSSPSPSSVPKPSPSPAARPSPSPAGRNDPAAGAKAKASFHIPAIVWWLMAAALLLILWRPVSRRVREAILSRGEPNAQAAMRYRHLRRLCRAAGLPVPPRAEELGLRARFSPHRITEAELGELRGLTADMERRLAELQSPLRRLLVRFLFAA